jgi:hypothetical protein
MCGNGIVDESFNAAILEECRQPIALRTGDDEEMVNMAFSSWRRRKGAHKAVRDAREIGQCNLAAPGDKSVQP